MRRINKNIINLYFFLTLIVFYSCDECYDEIFYYNMYRIDDNTLIREEATKITYSQFNTSNWEKVTFNELNLIKKYHQKITTDGEYRCYNSDVEVLYFNFKNTSENKVFIKSLKSNIYTKLVKSKSILVDSKKIEIMIFDEYKNQSDWGRRIIYAKNIGIIGYISFTQNAVFLCKKIVGKNVSKRNKQMKEVIFTIKRDKDLYLPYKMANINHPVIRSL